MLFFTFSLPPGALLHWFNNIISQEMGCCGDVAEAKAIQFKQSYRFEEKKLVVENFLAFNEGFWIRLAARTDTCKSEDDKKDYKELALSIMSIVDCLVHKTNEKINSAIDILKGVLKPVVDHVEEIRWPPRDPKALKLMEKAQLTKVARKCNLEYFGAVLGLEWIAHAWSKVDGRN